MRRWYSDNLLLVINEIRRDTSLLLYHSMIRTPAIGDIVTALKSTSRLSRPCCNSAAHDSAYRSLIAHYGRLKGE